MAAVKTIFWDLGGVLLSDAWDHTQRAQALADFQLDENDFQQRHEPLVPSFERGELSLDQYLERTIFYRARTFTREAFRNYMFSLSKPKPDMIALALELAKSGKYFMSTLNNESTDLNLYRIQTFGLRDIFSLFVSSCFVRMRKPDEEIYRLALQITQQRAEAVCFLDDRPANLQTAAQLGMRTIQVKTFEQVRKDLQEMGVN